MSFVDAVAKAIWGQDRSHEADCCDFTDCEFPNYYRNLAQAAISVLRPVVSTVEQLDALPANTTILDADEWAWQKDGNPESLLWIPAAWNAELLHDSNPSLPAVVLWIPETGEQA